MGTPTEDKWPGISMSEELVAYNFPSYPPEPLVKRAPRLDQEGLDLVEKFLLYEAKKRISARSAMRHPYFGPSLGPAAIENLLDGKRCFLVIAKELLLNLSSISFIESLSIQYSLYLQFSRFLRYLEFNCQKILVIDHQLLITHLAENQEGKACYCDLEIALLMKQNKRIVVNRKEKHLFL